MTRINLGRSLRDRLLLLPLVRPLTLTLTPRRRTQSVLDDVRIGLGRWLNQLLRFPQELLAEHHGLKNRRVVLDAHRDALILARIDISNMIVKWIAWRLDHHPAP